ncbi:ATP-grasp peptide maturase system methyltransferase [Kitasatospora purpeofusca]|uniref:ATP-grasp peptide maturase system methyltransferase n=1 Tax=Kitasatospora purpeofusca TaxID=67352 RepID=UPI002A5AED12|nr:ATP-grasp peptide maturase system methyltransferase [Kitasatospora purpeofusca]MDY0816098.1 ATP-grasp peptide maturase system methyltransferase [Kitasatospora purpeofusca]
MTTDTQPYRSALAGRLAAAGHLTTPQLRAAVEATPRELFLHPGVFLPTDDGHWQPVTQLGTDPAEWARIAYLDESLVTQLDNHLTADQASEPLAGFPTSSSTTPVTVVAMIEALDLHDGHTVLEVGTGTGYSTALLCHRLGEDNVTSIEVDPDVARRADAALEQTGHSTWTVTGDGLLGHPRRAPYDKVIATCAVRRIPHAWIRQTRPGGTVLATVGSWTYGTGLVKVTVNDDGTAEGRIVSRSSFMPARSQADRPLDGDLAARAAYPDTERLTALDPAVLRDWMPAFLAQLAAPGAQLVRATTADGDARTYLFDTARESFAELTETDGTWTVRQGGPVALWDAVEDTITAWREAGQPAITDVRLQITSRAHTYWIGGQRITTAHGNHWIGEQPKLRWEHRIA